MGLACQQMQITPESLGENQPRVHASGVALVFDGRLDNRNELLHDPRIGDAVCLKSADTEFVLAAYHAYGEAFAEKLSGDFALGLFDPVKQRLLLARDAIGIRPLYYCRREGLLLFATEIKALLAHPRVVTRANEDVIADFLVGSGASTNFAGATLFDGICSVPPAHVLLQTANRFQLQRYWDFDPDRKIRFKSFLDYADAFRYHFEQSVQRRLRSTTPVAVSVSGGLDSSAILCMAETLRRKGALQAPALQGISYISSDGGPADERNFLADIEQRYGIDIQKIPMAALGFVEGSKASMWFAEDLLLDRQATFNQMFLGRARGDGARVLLTGHWGDQVLAGTSYLVDLAHTFAWRKVYAHLKEIPRWMTDVDSEYSHVRGFLRHLALIHAPEASVPLLRMIRSALGRAPPALDGSWYTEGLKIRANGSGRHADATKPRFGSLQAESLYDEVRRPYHVQCMEWNNKIGAQHGLEMAFPFLDRELLSFLMAIPGEMHSFGGVSRGLLRQALSGVLPDSIRQRTWKADFTQLCNDGMGLDATDLMDYLSNGCRAAALGYVDEGLVRHELVSVYEQVSRSKDCVVSTKLRKLLGLEIWCRTFLPDVDSQTVQELTSASVYSGQSRS
jgi:asparagine synthase (glutamine-hydrolysing)